MKYEELEEMRRDFNNLKWKLEDDYADDKLRNSNLLGTDYIKSLIDDLAESWWTAGAELHLEKLMNCYDELDNQRKIAQGCIDSFKGKYVELSVTTRAATDADNTNG